jgi:hypothetical protein
MLRSPRSLVLIAATVAACNGDRTVSPSDIVATPAVDTLVALNIIGASPQMVLGSSATMSITATDNHGQRAVPPPVTWSSSNSVLVRIDTAGVATAVGLGMATIRAFAEYSGAYLVATTVVDVVPVTYPAPADTALALFPAGEFGDTIVLAPGQTLQLNGYEYLPQYPGPNLVQAAYTVTWASSHPELATVSSSGVVTAVAPGNADIRASTGGFVATLTVRIAATPGTSTVKLVNATAGLSSLTFRLNSGPPIPLAYGQTSDQTVPAGTLQVIPGGFAPTPLSSIGDEFGLQQFLGIVPAGTHVTMVALENTNYAQWDGGVVVAPLWDLDGPTSADSAIVRVVLATTGGYNVYFTPHGGQIGTVFLQGCYLDWPFGFTQYVRQPPGTFDIVLQPGKGLIGQEAARFTVTPSAGHATTYVISGNTVAALNLITIVDR